MMQEIPQSLPSAIRYFSDIRLCTKYMRKIKWPDGFAAFNELAKRLVKVPKTEVDRRIARRNRRKKK